MTLNRCLGMWWRQEDFALDGTGQLGEMVGGPSYAALLSQPAADRRKNAVARG